MALKMLYRGPSSRLETLIEKIQQNKEQDIYSSHTSSSFSPSLSDGILTPNSMSHVDNDNQHTTNININNNNNNDKSSPSIRANEAIDLKRKLCKDNDDENSLTLEENGKKIKCENNTTTNNNINTSSSSIVTINGKSTSSSSNNKLNNKISSDGSYHCQFCDKTFPRLGYLKKHEQSHAEHMPFKCDYCARLFKHKRSRDRHTKLHTGDRRYKCPHCEAAFSRSDHLKIHMKTHDNQKPFQCTVCNRGYNTAAALTSHMQNHKKQAALLASGGNPNSLNYSPRSTGSGSSTTSGKRKYSNIPLDQLKHNHNGTPPILNHLPSRTITCMFCTKSDFGNIEQLNLHIQSMHNHSGSSTPNPITQHRGSEIRSPSINASSPNIALSCEFCTMKFSSIQQIFQHLKMTHLDRISSPNSYLEHFNRTLMSTYDLTSLASPNSLYRKLHNHKDGIKIESKTPESCEVPQRSPNLISNNNIKQEKDLDQESPTDLSQPKIKNTIKEEITSHDSNNSKSIADESNNHLTKSPASTPAFLCNQCSAALPDFESFRTHLKSHLESGVGSYLCQHCGIPFNDQQIYEKHVFSHFLVTTTEHSCPKTCNKNFAKQEDYQKHLLDTHIQTIYKCDICSEVFDTKISIQVHLSVAHPNEIKLSRCSACMEMFRSEREFRHHVRTRHIVTGAVQCIFCRTICPSELDMHFHLAAHARQYRCPVCPETFHVEFLLDRHMQTIHHNSNKDAYHPKHTNNNNTIDYGQSLAGNIIAPKNHNPYLFNTNKFYNQLQIDTLSSKHPNLIHGLYDTINKTQRYPPDNGFVSPNKNLLGIYNHPEMMAKLNTFYGSENGTGNERFYQSQPQPGTKLPNLYETSSRYSGHGDATLKSHLTGYPSQSHDDIGNNQNSGRYMNEKGYSCLIGERNDISVENEAHSRRKVVHNLKTGVSLRCAYCNGDFRSRSELENHMKVSHNTSGKHKCLICDEIFPSPAVLAEHKLTHCKVGPSGRCSHCLIDLKDVTFFKSHLAEHNGHDIPVQCICCRQTLNSEFEIGLHAKFHTKTSEIKENTCALCLETLPPNVETRVCENCYKKHNLNLKTQQHKLNYLTQQNINSINNNNNNNNLTNNNSNNNNVNNQTEIQCNLCKKNCISTLKLQEHLIEHTFAGCEDRGYICYICSSVFTIPSGLQSHIIEHGLNSRPYDCNLCPAKYFFRAELDNHLIDHENVIQHKTLLQQQQQHNIISNEKNLLDAENLKKEKHETIDENNENQQIKQIIEEDDEEYIEVENIIETGENHLKNEKSNETVDNI